MFAKPRNAQRRVRVPNADRRSSCGPLTETSQAGGGKRLGACLDCCHLIAAGFEIRSPGALGAVIDEFDAKVGLDRLRCVHVNDSKVPIGANRDRHANLGQGELGRKGLRVYLSERRFQDLPALIETPGPDGKGPDRKEVRVAKRLHREGLRRGG